MHHRPKVVSTSCLLGTQSGDSEQIGVNLPLTRRPMHPVCIALAASVLFIGMNARADVYIRTNPTPVMVADGQTEYRIDILADTTEHPGVQFNLWEGRFWVPAGLDFIRVEHPDPVNNPSQNPNDLFFGWQMFANPGEQHNLLNSPTEATGNVTWPLRTPLNSRLMAVDCQGPTNNSNRLVGTYFFTVNPSAVPRTGVRFLTGNDKLRGDCVDYRVSNCSSGGACLRQEHGEFAIIPPGDMDMNTLVDTDDVQLFVGSLLDPVAYAAQRQAGTIGSGDMNLDGILDAKDIQGFVNKLLGL